MDASLRGALAARRFGSKDQLPALTVICAYASLGKIWGAQITSGKPAGPRPCARWVLLADCYACLASSRHHSGCSATVQRIVGLCSRMKRQ